MASSCAPPPHAAPLRFFSFYISAAKSDSRSLRCKNWLSKMSASICASGVGWGGESGAGGGGGIEADGTTTATRATRLQAHHVLHVGQLAHLLLQLPHSRSELLHVARGPRLPAFKRAWATLGSDPAPGTTHLPPLGQWGPLAGRQFRGQPLAHRQQRVLGLRLVQVLHTVSARWLRRKSKPQRPQQAAGSCGSAPFPHQVLRRALGHGSLELDHLSSRKPAPQFLQVRLCQLTRRVRPRPALCHDAVESELECC